MRNNLLHALRCDNSGLPPVWFMRQAGRYMRSYRKLRDRYSFKDLCLIPELAVQVTMQPVVEFDTDAAIIFSDILLPLLAMNVDVQFTEAGPEVSSPDTLRIPLNPRQELQAKLSGVYKAIRMVAQSIDRPLIGFIGAPWTLAAYLFEGKSPKTPKRAQQMIEAAPTTVNKVLQALEDLVVAHATLQVEAGCHAIQIFESSILLLDDSQLESFSFSPVKRILSRIQIPSIFFPTHAKHLQLFSSLPAALSLHHDIDLHLLRSSISSPVQGNLDPKLLLGPKDTLINEVKKIGKTMKGDRGFIFNLSGGVPKETDENVVRLVIETVRNSYG